MFEIVIAVAVQSAFRLCTIRIELRSRGGVIKLDLIKDFIVSNYYSD